MTAVTLRADCPRCGTDRITFDLAGFNEIERGNPAWIRRFEVFSVCRHCKQGTTFVLRLGSYEFRDIVADEKYWRGSSHLNDAFEIRGYVSTKDRVTNEPPEHVPNDIAKIYREGAVCASVECYNASATMFRLCVDLVTKPLLPEQGETSVDQPNGHQRRNLKPRIEWLLEQGKLPRELSELLDNLREDGNDGAHEGTLGAADVDDIADFTNLLLQRLYTDPARLKLATERRGQRRAVALNDQAAAKPAAKP